MPNNFHDVHSLIICLGDKQARVNGYIRFGGFLLSSVQGSPSRTKQIHSDWTIIHRVVSWATRPRRTGRSWDGREGANKETRWKSSEAMADSEEEVTKGSQLACNYLIFAKDTSEEGYWINQQ